MTFSDKAIKMPSYKTKNIWEKIQDKFRYGLILQSIKNRLEIMGILWFTPYYIVQEGIGEIVIPEAKCDLSDYSLEFFEPVDMKAIGEEKCGYSEERMIAMLEEGKKCYGMKFNGEIAVFMWIDLKECHYRPSRVPLEKSEAYLFHMYTMYPHRGKNLAPYLRYKCYEMLREMGRDTFYSVTEYFNSASMKFKQKLKAKPLKLIFYIELFRKLRWSFTIKKYS
ncbi:MAG: hypothetical protein KAI43_09225 [Candidatus Aureabacteria bacterium]|nr:hypothetical protein [Candidatus Auribacterota bacterium]